MSEMPSHFKTVCPNCLVDLKVPLSYSGSNIRCKHCNHKFRALVPDHGMTPGSEEFPSGTLNTSGPVVERLNVVCPSCSTAMNVRSTLAGQHVQCKQCNHTFLVPKIEEMPAHIGHVDPESRLFGQPDSQLAGAQSTDAEPRAAEQRLESAGSLAALREENERVSARLEALQREYAGIQAERDSLMAQLEQVRGDHDQLRTTYEEYGQKHHRMRDEPTAIGDAPGDLPASEIVALRDERQALGDENQRLREQVQSLQTELSSGLGLPQVVADREEELRLARLQAEAQRDLLNERIADREQALESSRAWADELAERVRQRDSELATKLGELQRLTALRQADAAAADELRGTLARREQELQQECEKLRGQIDEHHRGLVSTKQAHGEETSRLEEQHHLTRNELESARSEIGVLQARLSELQGLHAKLEAELESERSRHAEQIERLQARAEASAQLVERLKAEIMTIAQSRSAPDADLKAAREEIADLRAKLADTEITKRSMSSLLEGMGIRLH